MASTNFAFNLLTEPSTNTTTNVPGGFNVNIAWLLGQCCNITYQDYNQDVAPDLSSLTVGPQGTVSATLVVRFIKTDTD